MEDSSVLMAPLWFGFAEQVLGQLNVDADEKVEPDKQGGRIRPQGAEEEVDLFLGLQYVFTLPRLYYPSSLNLSSMDYISDWSVGFAHMGLQCGHV